MTKPTELSILNRLKGIASAGPTEDEKSLVWDNDTNSLKFIAPGNATAIQNIPVDVNGVQDGHVLTYDVTSGKFVPKPKPAGGGDFLQDSILNILPSDYAYPLVDSGKSANGTENIISRNIYGTNNNGIFVITKSSLYSSSFDSWKPFFYESTAYFWRPLTAWTQPEWIQIDLGQAYKIQKIYMQTYGRDGDYGSNAILIESSNDGVVWVTQTNLSGLNSTYFDLRIQIDPADKAIAYRYWKWTFTGKPTNSIATYMGWSELGLSLT